jgi:hypothetical protein
VADNLASPEVKLKTLPSKRFNSEFFTQNPSLMLNSSIQKHSPSKNVVVPRLYSTIQVAIQNQSLDLHLSSKHE